MVPVSMTLSDPRLGFQGHSIFLKSNVSKTVEDRAIVTIEHKYATCRTVSLSLNDPRPRFQGHVTVTVLVKGKYYSNRCSTAHNLFT